MPSYKNLLLLFYIFHVVIPDGGYLCSLRIFVKLLPKGLMLSGLPLVFYQYNGALYWSFSLQFSISFANSPAKGSPPPPPINLKYPLNSFYESKNC
jgi:hypothetical protein